MASRDAAASERLWVPAWTMRLYLRAASTALPAFPDVVRDGLLDVDVLAGLAGPDGVEGVPVVGRGDGDGVDVLVLQQLADVDIRGHLDVLGSKILDRAVQHGLVDVAQGDDPHSGECLEHLDVVTPFPGVAQADHCHPDGVVGPQWGGPRGPRENAAGRHTTDDAVHQKTTTADQMPHPASVIDLPSVSADCSCRRPAAWCQRRFVTADRSTTGPMSPDSSSGESFV